MDKRTRRREASSASLEDNSTPRKSQRLAASNSACITSAFFASDDTEEDSPPKTSRRNLNVSRNKKDKDFENTPVKKSPGRSLRIKEVQTANSPCPVKSSGGRKSVRRLVDSSDSENTKSQKSEVAPKTTPGKKLTANGIPRKTVKETRDTAGLAKIRIRTPAKGNSYVVVPPEPPVDAFCSPRRPSRRLTTAAVGTPLKIDPATAGTIKSINSPDRVPLLRKSSRRLTIPSKYDSSDFEHEFSRDPIPASRKSSRKATMGVLATTSQSKSETSADPIPATRKSSRRTAVAVVATTSESESDVPASRIPTNRKSLRRMTLPSVITTKESDTLSESSDSESESSNAESGSSNAESGSSDSESGSSDSESGTSEPESDSSFQHTPKKKSVRKAASTVSKTTKANVKPRASSTNLVSSPRKTPRKTGTNVNAKSPLKSPGKPGTSEWRFNSLGVPKCPLPCRESQFEEIWNFLLENISSKSSRCLYVSGVPGTGKTVIVKSVVDTLSRYANERKKHLEFNYAYINGLSLQSPDKIWKRFYCELKEQKLKLTPQMALKKLGSYFETKGRLPTVLVIDELDQILDKRQSILYQLLEWASHASNMFSLIAIFNTMSLPENGLANRNASRIGLIRCIFPPYDYDQLQTIVKNSLATCKSEKINDDGIKLLSRKVAAVSGDARRALEIAGRTVEIVESGQATGAMAVDSAFKEIFSSPKIETIKNCSFLEQMFLKTLSGEQQSTGNEETTMMNVYANLCPTAVYEGMNYTVDQFMNAGMRLSLMKLILCEKESASIHKRISLNVPTEDINYALGLKPTDSEV